MAPHRNVFFQGLTQSTPSGKLPSIIVCLLHLQQEPSLRVGDIEDNLPRHVEKLGDSVLRLLLPASHKKNDKEHSKEAITNLGDGGDSCGAGGLLSVYECGIGYILAALLVNIGDIPGHHYDNGERRAECDEDADAYVPW